MNVFGAIIVIIAVLGAVSGGFVMEFLLPPNFHILRLLLTPLSALLIGFLLVKLYLCFLTKRAQAAAKRTALKRDADSD